jgi:hypothetical protein
MTSNILSTVAAASHGVDFDPTNKKHRAAYAHFSTQKRWPEGMRFKSEWPSTSVVATVERKLVQHAIRSELKDLETAAIKAAA